MYGNQKAYVASSLSGDDMISSLMYDFAVKDSKCDHLCGVPYTALPIATLLSVKSKIPMLMRRKETKSYGTKKTIEGHYKAGQSCLIIEDVVTSGSSVLETVKDLKAEGLVIEDVIVILDREQGGSQNIDSNGMKLKSLYTMTQLINILLRKGEITKEMADDVRHYLSTTKAPVIKDHSLTMDRIKMSYEKRAELAQNPITKQLLNIMATKRTNLCLSADLTSTTKILSLLENVGEHVCMVKTHIDIIEDFNDDFLVQLKHLADKFNFLILEDRKFADIGNTVSLQYLKGMYKVAEWADMVTVHSLPGEGILKAFTGSINGVSRGVFLLAEMSSQGNLISAEYTKATIDMADKYSDLVTGFVCQNGEHIKNPAFIQLTPGVQLINAEDDFGQVYNTPETVVLEKGADVAVVGRGIVAAKNPESQAVIYKEALWECYVKRISNT
ncbi:Uridine 5'-monophosphate synthase [Eumeta japonica]|uniref:Orotidine 5'-phosphate decarboxylase n=1 Tax=Eumeta variegata TaxID=151549 RepID=A0A4C1YL87_EUMVA|nr:Uridine 5'-monophosphate synthase [Eumeta japonica]